MSIVTFDFQERPERCTIRSENNFGRFSQWNHCVNRYRVASRRNLHPPQMRRLKQPLSSKNSSNSSSSPSFGLFIPALLASKCYWRLFSHAVRLFALWLRLVRLCGRWQRTCASTRATTASQVTRSDPTSSYSTRGFFTMQWLRSPGSRRPLVDRRVNSCSHPTLHHRPLSQLPRFRKLLPLSNPWSYLTVVYLYLPFFAIRALFSSVHVQDSPRPLILFTPAPSKSLIWLFDFFYVTLLILM